MSPLGSQVGFLTQGLQSLRHRDKFTDFVVECEGTLFKVHRCILSAHSAYFEKALGEGFSEASKGSVTLADEKVGLVRRMLDYFYTLNYVVTDNGIMNVDPPKDFVTVTPQAWEWGDTFPALIHAQMYAMGDKYLICGLKKLAKSHFIKTAKNLSDLQLAAVIREVYTSTVDQDRGLRNLVRKQSIDRIAFLILIPEIKAIVEDVPVFGFELLTWTVKEMAKQNEYFKLSDACPTCVKIRRTRLFCPHTLQETMQPLLDSYKSGRLTGN